MDKQNIAYTYNGILLTHKKEWRTDVFYNVDGTSKILGLVAEARHKRSHIV